MGLAASQARYLDLTARKSNVEFQGQMVNQQRTELANESAGIFQEMLTIDPPTAPTQAEYTNLAYTFDGASSSSEDLYKLFQWDKRTDGSYDVKIEFNNGKGTASQPRYTTLLGVANLTFDAVDKDRITKIQMVSFDKAASVGEGIDNAINDIGTGEHEAATSSRTDNEAYEAAMNKHEYEKAQYQKKMNELSARTQEIQVQDRTLELQLRQLDTEQEALQTELESVKKVIESSIDQIFKTFQS